MKNKKTIFSIVAGVLGIGLIYYLSSSVIPRILVTFSKAAPATQISINDSYVLGSKILARADGEDKCNVNVFLMDEKRKGVAGKRVELIGAKGVVVIKDVTDGNGMASFEVTSDEMGQFELTAIAEGVPLNKGITVTFR
ncbi:Ig-like domain-containing protein [Patescibacteria group bacterium]|nr:Ig-like domain-containing protein [Patescibacteria group bacterium]MBU4430597.1 Ig-like domain-containing protein [Patescibacteria group bacterium]MCG2702098.1 Ig-like domain-containing protein [Candidatus Parcubacteria bacterium]